MTIHRSLTMVERDEDLKRLVVRPQVFAPLLPVPRLNKYNIRPPDMSTVQTWTLWQRMPPRYQLTTKTIMDDPDELVAIGTSTEKVMTPRKLSSPRPFSAGPKSPQNTSRPLSSRENFMLSSNVSESFQSEVRSESIKTGQPKGFSFPKRNSDYVSTFQKQRRVNSARRRLAEAPPTPNVASTQQPPPDGTSMVPRAHTAPVFPVTSPETHLLKKAMVKEKTNLQNAMTCKNISNIKPKLVGHEPSKVDIFQLDDAKSVTSSTSSAHKLREPEHKPKKYLVQDTNKATVFIDNGKVMYFGKSRHDLTQLLKTQSLRSDRNSCFLAEIRRDYLRHPKYDRGKGHLLSKSDSDPRRIAHERVDYNRRVEHILSYYDQNHPESRYSQTRPTSAYRAKSPIGSRMKGLSLTTATAAPSRPPSRSPSPEFGDASANDFIRLNRQSKLHERQFYLRTPGIQHGHNVAEMERCGCSMCRMELQLAVVTGVKEDTDLAMVAAANEAGTLGKLAGIGINACENVKYSRDINGGRIILNDTRTPKKPVVKPNTQKVSFQQPTSEVSSKANKVLINCKLPEMTDMPVSESGFESSRTQDVPSPGIDDVTENET